MNSNVAFLNAIKRWLHEKHLDAEDADVDRVAEYYFNMIMEAEAEST